MQLHVLDRSRLSCQPDVPALNARQLLQHLPQLPRPLPDPNLEASQSVFASVYAPYQECVHIHALDHARMHVQFAHVGKQG